MEVEIVNHSQKKSFKKQIIKSSPRRQPLRTDLESNSKKRKAEVQQEDSIGSIRIGKSENYDMCDPFSRIKERNKSVTPEVVWIVE